jgi:hypothetical protein
MAEGLDEPENCCTRSKAQAEAEAETDAGGIEALGHSRTTERSRCQSVQGRRLLGCVFPRYVSPASPGGGYLGHLGLGEGQPGAWMNARDVCFSLSFDACHHL